MDTYLLPLTLMLVLGAALGLLAGYAVGHSRALLADAAEDRDEAGKQAVVSAGLQQLGAHVASLQRDGVSWQSQFTEQVSQMRLVTESLRSETAALSTALRKPGVRGQWGEMHLRRTVELAGMVDRCDFTEQQRLDNGALRPDLVVRLAGGRHVVVDSKVPLDAFLDAVDTEDVHEHEHHLERHARQLRTHVKQLGSKAYWRSLASTPEFVVLFVPSEACLSAALEVDRSLIDDAAGADVIVATPTTLIALLRAVHYGWKEASLSTRAEEIHTLGRELHKRLGTLTDHLAAVGRSINKSAETYNRAVGSYESRVLVTARRLEELEVAAPGGLETPGSVELRAVSRRADDEPGAESSTVAS